MSDVLFGLDLPPAVVAGRDPVQDAVRAEEYGFDFVSTSDHPCGTDPTYETWTMLTWVAARTSRIGIATRVLGVPYRPPAIVAKMAETLDRLCSGRLILGLGGGYSDDEFRAFGQPVPTPRQKVDGMVDAIEIARGLWSRRALTYRGARYHTDSARIAPKPDRRIPIWLGTYGNRALAATGRLADGWIPSMGFAPPESIPALRDRIRAAAVAAGRAPDAVRSIYNLGIRVDGRAKPQPSMVAGGAEAVAERLIALRALGFAGFNLQPAGPGRAEQIERIATDVLPLVRAA